MPIPGQYENYEAKALEALQKGNVAEAQVWATLYQAESLKRVASRIDHLSETMT